MHFRMFQMMALKTIVTVSSLISGQLVWSNEHHQLYVSLPSSFTSMEGMAFFKTPKPSQSYHLVQMRKKGVGTLFFYQTSSNLNYPKFNEISQPISKQNLFSKWPLGSLTESNRHPVQSSLSVSKDLFQQLPLSAPINTSVWGCFSPLHKMPVFTYNLLIPSCML